MAGDGDVCRSSAAKGGDEQQILLLGGRSAREEPARKKKLTVMGVDDSPINSRKRLKTSESQMQLHRLALINLAEQDKIYCKWLLEHNVVVDLGGKSLEEIFKSHHNSFPHLPEFTIKGAVRRHMGFIVEADEVKTGLLKDTREEIEEDIEKHYEYEATRAYKIPDRLDWKLVQDFMLIDQVGSPS